VPPDLPSVDVPVPRIRIAVLKDGASLWVHDASGDPGTTAVLYTVPGYYDTPTTPDVLSAEADRLERVCQIFRAAAEAAEIHSRQYKTFENGRYR